MKGTIIDEKTSLNEVFLLTKAELTKGFKLRRHPFKYFALSTGSSMELGSRMVVLRNFNDEWDCIVYTDVRSNKVKQLQSNPLASLLFYHQGKKFQVSIQAKVEINHLNKIAIEAFNRLPSKAWKDYNSALPPGQLADSQDVYSNRISESPEKNFCLLLFKPIEISALQLRNDIHLKASFIKIEGKWKKSWVVP